MRAEHHREREAADLGRQSRRTFLPRSRRRSTNQISQHILLVGVRSLHLSFQNPQADFVRAFQGFGESAYLQLRLRKEFKHGGTRIVTADEPSKKAVAEGAALYYIKDSVVARATRFEFGIASNRVRIFVSEPAKAPLTERSCSSPIPARIRISGRRITLLRPQDNSTTVAGGCSASWSFSLSAHPTDFLLTGCRKGTIIEADTCHLEPVLLTVDTDVSLLDFRLDVYTYYDANGGLGINAQEGWSSSADGLLLFSQIFAPSTEFLSAGTLYNGFTHRCVVTADPISLAALQPVCTSLRTGDAFKELEFSVGIFFGSTSLRASLV